MSFEVGDKVIDLSYGIGTVTDIIQGSEYPIVVWFHGRYKEQYTEHGHLHKDAPCRALYHAEGFVYPRDKEPECKPKCQFKPFDKILVRDGTNSRWRPTFFGKLLDNGRVLDLNNVPWTFYIHYEGNEDKCWKVTKE